MRRREFMAPIFAKDEEFLSIINTRIRDPNRQHFHGVATVACGDIRKLFATVDSEKRRKGDRFYCILDTDMAGLPQRG
jgi:hypothetical protein